MRVVGSNISCGVKELIIESGDAPDPEKLKSVLKPVVCAMVITTVHNKRQRKFISLLKKHKFKPTATSQGYTMLVKYLTLKEQASGRAAQRKLYGWY